MKMPPATRDGEATRQRIVDLVASHPGIHKAEIRDRLGLAWSTVDHHLRVLDSSGRIALARQPREVRVYPAGLPADERPWWSSLQHGVKRRILLAAVQRPDVGIAALNQELGLPAKTVSNALHDLVDAGCMRRDGVHRPRFRVDPRLAEWLARQGSALASEPAPTHFDASLATGVAGQT